MLALVLSMLVILLLAGVVVAYVAYPHRGREMPAAPWLGDALRRGADRLPTVGGDGRDAPHGPAVAQPDAPRVPPRRSSDGVVGGLDAAGGSDPRERG